MENCSKRIVSAYLKHKFHELRLSAEFQQKQLENKNRLSRWKKNNSINTLLHLNTKPNKMISSYQLFS